MEAYAVIETGGKQYRVNEGSVLDVERLDTEEGKQVQLSQVLAVSDGSSLQVGAPTVSGAAITAEIVQHHRGDKVIAFKKKRRKGYRRKVGHRQDLTRIKVVSLSGSAPKKKAAAKKEKPAEEAAAE